MRTIFLITIISVSFFQTSSATEPIAVPATTAKEMEQLLTSMISPTEAWKHRHFLYPGAPNADKAEVEEAKKQLTKYHDDCLKLRALLKVGTSVLAYPGLIAHGEITYYPSQINYFSATDNKTPSVPVYHLYVGLKPSRGPQNFNIIFGTDGVIHEILTVESKY